MATELEFLVARAGEVQRRLEAQGATEDAQIVARLVSAVVAQKAKAERPYYTVSEAAELIGVSGQTIKNWISRGLMDAYRLGGRYVIPRAQLDDYRSIAEASRGIEPLPSRDEIVEAVRKGRRRFVWPVEPREVESPS